MILEEPANGRDPEGIAWMRGFPAAGWPAQGPPRGWSSHVLDEEGANGRSRGGIDPAKMVIKVSLAELTAKAATVIGPKAQPGTQMQAVVLAGGRRHARGGRPEPGRGDRDDAGGGAAMLASREKIPCRGSGGAASLEMCSSG